jgi:hypothetical protein
MACSSKARLAIKPSPHATRPSSYDGAFGELFAGYARDAMLPGGSNPGFHIVGQRIIFTLYELSGR